MEYIVVAYRLSFLERGPPLPQQPESALRVDYRGCLKRLNDWVVFCQIHEDSLKKTSEGSIEAALNNSNDMSSTKVVKVAH